MALREVLLRLAEDQVDQTALILLDPNGRVCGWLMGAQGTFGYDSSEMFGGTIDRLFTPEDLERCVPQTELESAARGGKGEDDRWLVRKDGTRIWVTGVVECLRDAEGRVAGYAKILQDRTDLKTDFGTLRTRIDALREELGSRNLLLTTMAHELRNPMGVIQNAVEIVRRSHPHDEQLAAPLQMLTRQVAYISTLIEDILESARLGAGKVALQIERIVLASVIQKAVESCGASVRAKRQSVELLLPSVPIEIEADATRLQQVFVNLISNASKFSPDHKRIWVGTMPENEYVTVRIRDEGRGIPPELLPHVFELFTQGKQEMSGSLGIGLSIVRQYVEMHGGTVAVRSPGIGRGSEFIVRLPVRQDSRPSAPHGASAP
jgi:PAS domain S-box-containing protein